MHSAAIDRRITSAPLGDEIAFKGFALDGAALKTLAVLKEIGASNSNATEWSTLVVNLELLEIALKRTKGVDEIANYDTTRLETALSAVLSIERLDALDKWSDENRMNPHQMTAQMVAHKILVPELESVVSVITRHAVT